MIKSKNKIYIGSSLEGYIDEDMIAVIFEYLKKHEIQEKSKAKSRKIGEHYLIEIEANEHTMHLLKKLKNMSTIKLYKRTHSWDEIYKMSGQVVKSS